MTVPNQYYPTGTFQEWATLVSSFVAPNTSISFDESQWMEWANAIRVFSNFGSDGALVNDEIPNTLNQATWQDWANDLITKMNNSYP